MSIGPFKGICTCDCGTCALLENADKFASELKSGRRLHRFVLTYGLQRLPAGNDEKGYIIIRMGIARSPGTSLVYIHLFFLPSIIGRKHATFPRYGFSVSIEAPFFAANGVRWEIYREISHRSLEWYYSLCSFCSDIISGHRLSGNRIPSNRADRRLLYIPLSKRE